MVGDITNLAGALWANLVPTVIALAIYFCFADAILLAQCFYYNIKNGKRDQKELAEESANGGPTEEEALLGRRRTNSSGDNLGLPGSHSRRRSSATSRKSRRNSDGRNDSLSRILEEETSSRTWLKNALSVVLILVAGAAGWAIAWRAGAWKPTPIADPGEEEEMPLGALILGYISAVCYLGARIPQIVKNHKDRSTDGLSLLFFLLSMLGNVTYGAGILFHSVEKQYFMKNLPWLIGSLGTIAEDVLIFVQFKVYGEKQAAIE